MTMTADTSTDRAAWEARFRIPRTLWVARSAVRPERGLASTNRTGAYQLERWSVETGELVPFTHEPSGRYTGWLSPDGEWVVWHQDEAGDERGHFVAVPWAGGDPVDLTPDLPRYASFSAGFGTDGSFVASIVGSDAVRLLVVGFTADGPTSDVVQLDPGPGFVTQVALGGAPRGEGAIRATRLAYATTGGTGLALKLRILDVRTGDVLDAIDHAPGAIVPVAYATDRPDRLLLRTSRSGEERPALLEGGELREFPLDDTAGGLDPIDISADGDTVLLKGAHRAVEQLYLLDVPSGRLTALDALTGRYQAFDRGAGTFLDADGSVVVTREDATTPPEVIAFDPIDGSRRVLIAASEVPRSRPFRSVDIPTTEGAVAQAWLAVPDGPGPFPTILETHGGPQANETDRFNAEAQAWVDQGFAFLTLNYRGSTGFGRDYEQAIWGRVGELETADLAAAQAFLVDEGIARRNEIVLTGGSYGGYLTLLGLGRLPDRFAAGVAYVAIADWRLMWEDGESLREYQEALFEGTPAEKPELHASASPISYVDRLAAPLRIVQGRNDARCPARQAEVYIDAAERLGKSIEVEWFDAGHGHGAIEMRIHWLREAMRFVDGALGRSHEG
jgi:dipeptidyl aminopeptidase/acylaminoacyl peptidase